MRIFIDSAVPSTWQPYADAGVLYGVTTNPLIFQKEGVRFSNTSKQQLVAAAKGMGLAEIQFQITGINHPQNAVADFMRLFEVWPEGVICCDLGLYKNSLYCIVL